MGLRIAYLAEQGLSLNGVSHSLQYMFPDAEIFPVAVKNLMVQELKNLDVLVLPGNNTEDSPYPHFLPNHRINTLRSSIQQDGLVLFTLCAASYYMASEIEYETRAGIIKKCEGANLIQGKARQAFRDITRTPTKDVNDILRDYVQAHLHSADLPHTPLTILNVNGPAFHLDSEEKDRCDIFLNYKNMDGAAGLIKPLGKGLIIALGVHPELSVGNSDHKKFFPEHFAHHEKDRFTLLNILRTKIENHFSRKPWVHPGLHHLGRSYG